jgi:pimeloyl-ACP methyl ester carboxylesterase
MSRIRLQDWLERGRYVNYRDHQVFCVEEGEGDVIVNIHGFPTASFDWTRIWADLTSSYRVIAPDMMGFGFSDKPADYHYSLFDQADLYQSIMKEMGVSHAHFLCHDYGDTVGQELLVRERLGQLSFGIDSMCFLNGGIIPGEHRPRLVQRLLMSPLGPLVGRLMSEARFYRTFAAIFGPGTQPDKQELHDFWSLIRYNQGPRVMHKIIRYMAERIENSDRWVGALCETDTPLRFINGPEDPVSGRHMAEVYSRLVPDPDVVYLEGIGHYPQFEAPELMLNAFLPFVEQSSTRGSGAPQ